MGQELPPGGQSELWARGANTEVTWPPPFFLLLPHPFVSVLPLLSPLWAAAARWHSLCDSGFPCLPPNRAPAFGRGRGTIWAGFWETEPARGAAGTPLPRGGVAAGRATGRRALLASVTVGRCTVLTPDCCRCSLFSSVESQSVLSTSLMSPSLSVCLPPSCLGQHWVPIPALLV